MGLSNEAGDACSAFYRDNNSTSPWLPSGPSINHRIKRIEVIQQGASTPMLDLGADLEICDDDHVEISSGLSEADYQIQWNTGETTPSIIAQTSGWYVATITGPCAQLKDSVQVEFLTTPYNFSLGEDILACEFKGWILEAPDDPSFQVLWDDGSNQPKREMKNVGTYWATLSNACGVTSDTLKIKMISQEPSVPNIITPNGDEFNESFVIGNETEIPISLEIFNRWGERVHYSPSYDNQWNGTGLASGVYYFIMGNGCLGSRKGVVNILR
ncbi:MAG TPA: gliding motility-associated C-terminal domain-containing protein [Chryseolinea sp.]|nr:gliding motility-associated C-terminal domain-containing protein [Chryseolinea sp.]